MPRRNRFVIRNDMARPLIVNVEPEGSFIPLATGEEVAVTDTFETAPVTLKLSDSERGGPILSIWPGDGEVKVEKDGIDVIESLSSEACVR